MSIRRGWLNWGVFLIVLGAIPLAVEWGMLDRAAVAGLLRLWPLLLIGIGLGLILRFTSLQLLGGLAVAATLGILAGALITAGPGAAATACVKPDRPAQLQQLERGTFAGDSVALSATSTCSDVEIIRAPGRDYAVDVGEGSSAPEAMITADSIAVSDDRPGAPFGQRGGAWRLTLPTDASISSSLTFNAGSVRIDLGGGAVSSFSATLNATDTRIDLSRAAVTGVGNLGLTINASSTRLSLPAASMSGNITANAADLRLCVPSTVGLRISFRDTLSSNNFAAAGLTRSGDEWQTDGYAAAAQQLDLRLSANVSSINLERDGGCQ